MDLTTRAGGLVRRCLNGETVYLLVTGRGNNDEWLLPKGHIEPGETAEQAAQREVREETGIEAALTQELCQSEFDLNGEHVLVLYYLLDFKSVVAPPESGRRVVWCRFADALEHLSYPEGRSIIQQAHKLTSGGCSAALSNPAGPSV